MERLDKIIASQGRYSRSEVKKLVKAGLVTVNNSVVRSADIKCDVSADDIIVDGERLNYKKHIYIMLNKPKGVISATDDPTQKTVIDLVPPELKRAGIFPAGRLDADTTGFVLITDDGDFAHRILSPKNHIMKTYHATVQKPLSEEDIVKFKEGLTLGDGTKCLEAHVRMLPEAEKNALLYGDWDSFSGQVFSEWVDDKAHYEDRQWTHVIAPFRIPKDWTVVRGFDFGYAKPFSVGWYAVDRRGCIYRIAEYYGCTETANTGIMINPVEIAAEIKRIESENENLRGRTITGIADPSIFDRSRGESVADLMAMPPNFILWSGGDNTRIAGKMQYHYRFMFNKDGLPMFYCFNTCKHFIRTIPALVYDDKKVEDINTEQEDHIYDETRYFLMSRPIAPRVGVEKPKGRPKIQWPLND